MKDLAACINDIRTRGELLCFCGRLRLLMRLGVILDGEMLELGCKGVL